MKLPLVGFCPIGKFVFSHEDALRYKKLIEKKLKEWGIRYEDIDDVIKDGIVRSLDDVEIVVKHFKSRNIDALFLPHCNFGTEHAVGLIARELSVPVLLWGPRDEAPLKDGTRKRDTLCGLLATSKVLNTMAVPFTYIENCRVEDKKFQQGFMDFLRTANIVKSFRRMRIGQIGQRIDFFWSTIINEQELLQKFNVEIHNIDIIELIRAVKARALRRRKYYNKEIATLRRKVKIEGFQSDEPMINVLALRDEMFEIARARKLDAFAVQSFMSICEELGAMIEFALAEVTEKGCPAICETDIHGAISSVILQRASFDIEPTFLADFTVRHPEDNNSILLWHCAFPLALADKSIKPGIGTHWILPGIPPGSCHWRLKEGNITVARFDGDNRGYKLAMGEGKTTKGPDTLNTYVWIKVNNWPVWERQLIEGPYPHHVAAIYGNYAASIMEACKYMKGLEGVILGKEK